jgi:hypothetical protein
MDGGDIENCWIDVFDGMCMMNLGRGTLDIHWSRVVHGGVNIYGSRELVKFWFGFLGSCEAWGCPLHSMWRIIMGIVQIFMDLLLDRSLRSWCLESRHFKGQRHLTKTSPCYFW